MHNSARDVSIIHAARTGPELCNRAAEIESGSAATTARFRDFNARFALLHHRGVLSDRSLGRARAHALIAIGENQLRLSRARALLPRSKRGDEEEGTTKKKQKDAPSAASFNRGLKSTGD